MTTLDEFSTATAFGDPDGSRVDTLEVVSFNSIPGGASLDFSGRDRRSRVIVGQKGSGKTVYLRKLRESVMEDSSMAVLREEPSTQLLRTKEVLRVAHWYPEQLLTEIWMQIWRSAILASTAEIVLTRGTSEGYVRPTVHQRVLADFRSLYPREQIRERGVFACARAILSNAKSGASLSKLLDRGAWDDLEDSLSLALKDMPPVFIFVDTIDEELRSAPMYWLRCQKGLFYQVMRFLRSPELGGRLHIVIAIRDLVLSSVHRSEHAPRYRSDRHIRMLSWSQPTATRFLDHKLSVLPEAFIPDDSSGTPFTSLEAWIGLQTVKNRLGQREAVTNYVLRHTHMLPRDINLMGNVLGELVRDGRISEANILSAVSSVAKFSGQSNLDVVANQLLSDLIPVSASEKGFDEFYTSSQEYARWSSDQVRSVLQTCKSLWPTAAEIDSLQDQAQRLFDRNSDLLSALWQNGLIGYVDNDRHRFYSLAGASSFVIPDAEQYVFHPSLREVAGLLPGKDVVIPEFSLQ